MQGKSLTLLLCGFQPPVDGEWPPLPALQRLLSKGRGTPLATDPLATIISHFDLPLESVAPISALGDGLDASAGWWLCADPVHLVADRDQLFLSASSSLDVTQQEADSLVAELNRTYAEEGWQFYAPTPHHWYLRLPEPLAIQTIATSEAMGRRVGEVLPQGEEALQWQRVMTEVQMLLHASSVNLHRESQGALTINGLWFWGGGSMPPLPGGCGWDSVIGEHALSRGLATLFALPVGERGKRVLYHSIIRTPEEAEERLFLPLLQRLVSGELEELIIELPGLGRWRIVHKDLRRWWRRIRPLNTLFKGLA